MEKYDEFYQKILNKIEARRNGGPARNRRSRKHFFFLLNIILLGIFLYLYTDRAKDEPRAASAVFESGDVRVRLILKEEETAGYTCLVSFMSSSDRVRMIPIRDGRVATLDFILGNESIYRQDITVTETSLRLVSGETRVFNRYIDDVAINMAAKKSLENERKSLPQFLGLEKRRVKIRVNATLLIEGGGSNSLVLDYLPR
jgi:hypothetical protein